MSERRLACARSSSSPAGMSVDHSVTSRSRSSTTRAASAMSRDGDSRGEVGFTLTHEIDERRCARRARGT